MTRIQPESSVTKITACWFKKESIKLIAEQSAEKTIH